MLFDLKNVLHHTPGGETSAVSPGPCRKSNTADSPPGAPPCIYQKRDRDGWLPCPYQKRDRDGWLPLWPPYHRIQVKGRMQAPSPGAYPLETEMMIQGMMIQPMKLIATETETQTAQEMAAPSL